MQLWSSRIISFMQAKIVLVWNKYNIYTVEIDFIICIIANRRCMTFLLSAPYVVLMPHQIRVSIYREWFPRRHNTIILRWAVFTRRDHSDTKSTEAKIQRRFCETINKSTQRDHHFWKNATTRAPSFLFPEALAFKYREFRNVLIHFEKALLTLVQDKLVQTDLHLRKTKVMIFCKIV